MAGVSAPSMPKSDKIGGLDKWRVEDDLRTLRNVEEIKNDKTRLSAVMILRDREMKTLSKIANDAGMLGNDYGVSNA